MCGLHNLWIIEKTIKKADEGRRPLPWVTCAAFDALYAIQEGFAYMIGWIETELIYLRRNPVPSLQIWIQKYNPINSIYSFYCSLPLVLAWCRAMPYALYPSSPHGKKHQSSGAWSSSRTPVTLSALARTSQVSKQKLCYEIKLWLTVRIFNTNVGSLSPLVRQTAYCCKNVSDRKQC